MRQFEQDNVILIEGDEGELTLYVRDENVSAQELALLPDELGRIVDVIGRHKQSTAGV
jgi:hypothetical protein